MIRIFNAIQLVVKRSKANWKLLSSIVVGVVVAVALLSSTPLYSNALNDLGLRHALDNEPIEMMDLDVYSSNNPIDRSEYEGNTAFINQQIDSYVGPLIRQRERFVLTPSFNVMVAGQVIPTDPTRPRGYFQSYTNLEHHVVAVEGRLPAFSGDVASPQQIAELKGASNLPTDVLLPDRMTSPDIEIEAVISPRTADLMHVGVGERLIVFAEGRGSDPVHLNVRIVGLVEPVDPEDEFWFLRKDAFDAPSDEGIIVPLFTPEDTVFDIFGTLSPTTRLGYHWYYYVDVTRIDSTQARQIAAAVEYIESTIATKITNTTVFTRLDVTITEYLDKQLFTQVPLYLLVFQIAAIIFYYIVTVASMVIEQETGEIALLRSRGASTFQIFGVFLTEGLLISAFGGLVGPFLGALVFGLLGMTGPFAPLTGGGPLPVRFSTPVFILAGVAAGLCLLAFMIPAIQASRRGIVHHRQMVARPPRAPVWQRYYVDIALLVVGGGLYYELKQRGNLLTQRMFGDLGVDPLLLVTPLLFMLAVAIVFLRVFPMLVNIASRLSRYMTSSVVVLTLRYMARNPIHYSRLILLLMMAASVGMFSASFLGTLNRSYFERVAYAVGSEVRLENPLAYGTGKQAMIEQYSSIEGVEKVSLAYRGTATVGTFTQTDSVILAIDPSNFDDLTWYRQDFSTRPISEIVDILGKDTPTTNGLPLPDGTEAIGLWISPVYEPNPRITLLARVQDGRGFYTDITLGSPQYNDWQYIEGSLRDSLGNLPVSPLRLYSIYLSVAGGTTAGLQGLYLDDLQVRGSFSDQPAILEDFDDIAEWTALSEFQSSGSGSQGSSSDSLSRQGNIVYAGSYAARYTWGGRPSFRGIFPNLEARPLLGVASQSFLSSVGVSVGDWITIRIPGQFLSISIEEAVDYFPTLDPARKPFLLLNYDRLVSAGLTSNNRLYPNEIWLDVSPDQEQRTAAIQKLRSSGYRADKLYDREDLLAAQKADPLVAAGWSGILLIAFVGVILVSGLGFVVYAYLSARGRHLEFAVLRTLGFSWRQIISLVCFEQVFVIGIGMGIGTLLGNRLSRIMMPFLQLTEKGEAVVPPFILVTDWPTISVAYVILSVAFVATMSLVVLFFSRVALHRALRMGDE